MINHIKKYSWLYFGAATLLGATLFYLVFSNPGSGYVEIKYRYDKVNISTSNFEQLNKSDSTVKGAWYDENNEYMVINLNGTYYHYCALPNSVWSEFKGATSLDDYYQDDIRGNFDCRVNPVPDY